ncbi:MAG TPA: hypothetical protein VHA52_08415 [Candidatus Babeliaceae bacterium]|nr:hypothetical protein [Candidatus Babeliaceae bacterium]
MILTILEIPKSWELTAPVRNLLFKPVQLGTNWSKYFNYSLPERVNRIVQDMKTCDKVLGAIAFAPAMIQVYEGPKEKGNFLKASSNEVQQVHYAPLLPRAALYMGFVSKLLKSVSYFMGDKKPPLLSNMNLIVDALSEGVTIGLKVDLVKKLTEASFAKSEVIFAVCQGLLALLKLSLTIIEYMEEKEKQPRLFNLALSTALTAASYFSHYYHQWSIAPRKPK